MNGRIVSNHSQAGFYGLNWGQNGDRNSPIKSENRPCERLSQDGCITAIVQNFYATENLKNLLS